MLASVESRELLVPRTADRAAFRLQTAASHFAIVVVALQPKGTIGEKEP